MNNKKIDLLPSIFLIYLIILQMIKSLFGIYSNTFIILGIIGYILSLYFYYKRFILRFSFIIFYILSNIFGVYIIETTNLYLGELGYSSYNKQSLLLVTIAHLIFIEIIRIFQKNTLKYNNYKMKDYIYKINENIKIKKVTIIKVILFFIFMLNCILFIKVIDKPFFALKIDRFIYNEKYLSKISDILTNSYLYLAPIIGMYYYKTKDKKVFILVGSMCIYLFWIGHKFSFYLDLVYNIGLVFIMTIDYDKLNKIFSRIVILSSILLGIIIFQNIVIWDLDIDDSIEYLNRRVSQQGQLWWGIYENSKAKENNLDELKDEIKTYFKKDISDEDRFNSGIYKIMKLTTEKDIFDTKVYIKKSRYAYSTQATVYYYFKSGGLIVFSLISALFYLFINNNFIKSILSMKIISSILWARLSVMTARVLIQSDFDKLFSFQTIGIFFILYTMTLFEKYKIKK